MRQKCWFIDSTCFGHKYAHRQEYSSEFHFLVSKPGKPSGLCSAGLLDVCTVQRMWPVVPGTGFLTRLVAMVEQKAFGGNRLLGDCGPTIECWEIRGLEVERLPKLIVYERNRRRRDLILRALDDRDSSNSNDCQRTILLCHLFTILTVYNPNVWPGNDGNGKSLN
jgi:hypothetical protein